MKIPTPKILWLRICVFEGGSEILLNDTTVHPVGTQPASMDSFYGIVELLKHSFLYENT